MSVGNNQRRSSCTSRWRNRSEMFRIIEMVDGLGDVFRRDFFGRMATKEHNKILSILKRRACCFQPELRLLQEQEALKPSIYKTWTLSSFEADQRERERRESGTSDGGNRGKGSHGKCFGDAWHGARQED